MGQYCSCIEYSTKYQRRQSDNDVDMNRSDDESDQEMEVLVGHDHMQNAHELFGARTRTNSNCRNGQREAIKRTGSSVAFGLLTDTSKTEEEEKKEEDMQRCFSKRSIGLDGKGYCVTSLLAPEQLSKLLHVYQEATGVVDQGQLDLECIMCLDTFFQDNPKVRTLCSCGMNRTNFHMSCLLEWLNRDTSCPVCRDYLFFED